MGDSRASELLRVHRLRMESVVAEDAFASAYEFSPASISMIRSRNSRMEKLTKLESELLRLDRARRSEEAIAHASCRLSLPTTKESREACSLPEKHSAEDTISTSLAPGGCDHENTKFPPAIQEHVKGSDKKKRKRMALLKVKLIHELRLEIGDTESLASQIDAAIDGLDPSAWHLPVEMNSSWMGSSAIEASEKSRTKLSGESSSHVPLSSRLLEAMQDREGRLLKAMQKREGRRFPEIPTIESVREDSLHNAATTSLALKLSL